jgi:phosphoribosylformylglycinamidine cyclo-ligase
MARYKDAGVDISLGDSIKDHITQLVRSTHSDSVVTFGGEFGGIYRVPFSNTLAITSIDGVGTKLKVAVAANLHSTVGQDLVNHSVNDIAVMGAIPAFFVDYFATGKLVERVVLEVIRGIIRACSNHSIALVGGETAQMPDLYRKDDYDLAGAITGFMKTDDPYLSRKVTENDVIIGFQSNGLHTNGYSLARRILFQKNKWSIDTYNEEIQSTWGQELLKIHKSYYQLSRRLIEQFNVCRLAHITGGGVPGNLARVIPEGLQAVVNTSLIPQQPIFSVLQKAGKVDYQEMYEVFNMGCGLMAICSSDSTDAIIQEFHGDAFFCGTIIRHEEGSKVLLNTQ